MKNTNIQISDSDIKAIIATLEALPHYGFFISVASDTPDLIDKLEATGVKLITHAKLDPKNMYLIAIAIDSAYKAIRNEMDITKEGLELIKPYVFTINKFQPLLSPLLKD